MSTGGAVVGDLIREVAELKRERAALKREQAALKREVAALKEPGGTLVGPTGTTNNVAELPRKEGDRLTRQVPMLAHYICSLHNPSVT
jgi:cell division protein FtsB